MLNQITTTGTEIAPRIERKRYTGQVVYLYAFDTAYEMARKPITHLMGIPVEPYGVDNTKRNPRSVAFSKAQRVRLPPAEWNGPLGPVKVERNIKLLDLGAVSISIHVPFEVDHVEDLVAFHDLHLGSRSLNEEVRELAEKVREELAPFYIRPVSSLVDEEAYTVFCLEAPLSTQEGLPLSAESWFQSHRRKVAALLTQEPDDRQLSRQEAEESTARYVSYYHNDLVVIDWDAALIVDEPDDFQDQLYIMELANLHLAELEAYDRMLDEALDRSYRDLRNRPLRGRAAVLHELKELRIDLARLSDELSNTTKFFGDWHLARVYQHIAARFHLADWQRSLDEKLRTLDDLYQLLQHDQTNRWMLILESTIVLLFIIDLIMLFADIQAK